MKKLFLLSAVCAAFGIALNSCGESQFGSLPDAEADSAVPVSYISQDKYLGSNSDLTESDAVKVANIYFDNPAETRSALRSHVKNVVAVHDTKGNISPFMLTASTRVEIRLMHG